MRKIHFFLFYLLVYTACVGFILIHASLKSRAELDRLREKAEMVKRLGLTDLCLFTEASYTRHLSQADLHTPFQNHPGSLEHFPSGSILMPPDLLRRMNEKLD